MNENPTPEGVWDWTIDANSGKAVEAQFETTESASTEFRDYAVAALAYVALFLLIVTFPALVVGAYRLGF